MCISHPLLVRHTAQKVRSVRRKHQYPERMILNHMNCLTEEQIIGLNHVIQGCRSGIQLSSGKAVKIVLI